MFHLHRETLRPKVLPTFFSGSYQRCRTTLIFFPCFLTQRAGLSAVVGHPFRFGQSVQELDEQEPEHAIASTKPVSSGNPPPEGPARSDKNRSGRPRELVTLPPTRSTTTPFCIAALSR